MNTERSISLSSLLSLTCWIAGTVVAICNLFTDHLDLGAVAGAFYAGAICLTIRAAIMRATVNTLTAFKLGKEAGHREAGGGPLRPI